MKKLLAVAAVIRAARRVTEEWQDDGYGGLCHGERVYDSDVEEAISDLIDRLDEYDRAIGHLEGGISFR